MAVRALERLRIVADERVEELELERGEERGYLGEDGRDREAPGGEGERAVELPERLDGLQVDEEVRRGKAPAVSGETRVEARSLVWRGTRAR